MLKNLIKIFFFILFMQNILYSQTHISDDRWQVDSVIVVKSKNYQYCFPLTHHPVLASIQLTVNRQPLLEERDYKYIAEQCIRFFSPLSKNDTLIINYKRLPLELQKKYVLFQKDSIKTTTGDSLPAGDVPQFHLKKVGFQNPFEKIPATLQTSGSLMRGVQVGSNQDLTLNSGLNLELSGKLADNIEIIAALTDEATPIQPEGNTQTLKEIDKVFVNFKTPYVQGTVGDFNLNYSESQFANVRRKLQGLTLRGDYNNQMLGATIATSRGFFNHISLLGQEGTQGPYQLQGKNGEQSIIVLAGTEKIWLDGRLLTRGASNDYIIEYGNGQVTFTHKQLVTSESRIEVDFEYFPASQKYSRNVYSAVNGLSFARGKLQLNTRYYQEADDPDQLIEEGGALTEKEKKIIAAAGDDPLLAYTDGANYLGDSLGNYIRKDTLDNQEVVNYFLYQGNKLGDYIVRFSYVGAGEGDYIRDRIGIYTWVGKGKGDYSPIRLLPIPSKHEMTDIQASWQIQDQIKLKAEYAISKLDKNRLSPEGDTDNVGSALRFAGDIERLKLKSGDLNFGELGLKLDGKYIEKEFQGVDRISIPDYQRYWNLSNVDAADNFEKSLAATIHYKPITHLTLAGNAGTIEKTKALSERYAGSLQFDHMDWFDSELKYENIYSDRDSSSSTWERSSAMLQKEVWRLKPRVSFSSEERKLDDRSRLTGFKFDSYEVSLGFINWKYFNGNVRYLQRNDWVYDPENTNVLVPQSSSATKEFILASSNLNETQLSLHIIQRTKDYTEEFENVEIDSLKLLYLDLMQQDTTFQDRSTNLAELNVSHSRWKKAFSATWQYRVSTENTALKEKIYLEVGQGNGNLRFDDDLQEYVPDTDGNYILYILPSGKFTPVTNLQTSLRLRLDPYRYWKGTVSGWQKILKNISSETFMRIEEESKEENVQSIYFLNVSKFQQDQTIRGLFQFNEDLYILKRDRDLSFRIRYHYNQALLNQYLDAQENQKSSSRDGGLLINWRPFRMLRSKSEIKAKEQYRNNKSNNTRNRDIIGYYLDQRFSLRFKNHWEGGLEIELASENNRAAEYPLKLWYSVAKTKLAYALPGQGRISGEYQFQKVGINDNPQNLAIPYEMAKGKKEGLSKTWQLRAEYTLMKNILFTFFYSGRDEAGFDRVIHSGQAEVRAFF